MHQQYYDDTYPSVKEQKAFEKNIFNKTHRTDSKYRNDQHTVLRTNNVHQFTYK